MEGRATSRSATPVGQVMCKLQARDVASVAGGIRLIGAALLAQPASAGGSAAHMFVDPLLEVLRLNYTRHTDTWADLLVNALDAVEYLMRKDDRGLVIVEFEKSGGWHVLGTLFSYYATHPSDEFILHALRFAGTLLSVPHEWSCAEGFMAGGGVEAIVALLREWPARLARDSNNGSRPSMLDDVARDVTFYAAGVLWALTYHGKSVQNKVREIGGLDSLVALLDSPQAAHVWQALGAISNLVIRNDCNEEHLLDVGLVEKIVRIIASDQGDAALVWVPSLRAKMWRQALDCLYTISCGGPSSKEMIFTHGLAPLLNLVCTAPVEIQEITINIIKNAYNGVTEPQLASAELASGIVHLLVTSSFALSISMASPRPARARPPAPTLTTPSSTVGGVPTYPLADHLLGSALDILHQITSVAVHAVDVSMQATPPSGCSGPGLPRLLLRIVFGTNKAALKATALSILDDILGLGESEWVEGHPSPMRHLSRKRSIIGERKMSDGANDAPRMMHPIIDTIAPPKRNHQDRAKARIREVVGEIVKSKDCGLPMLLRLLAEGSVEQRLTCSSIWSRLLAFVYTATPAEQEAASCASLPVASIVSVFLRALDAVPFPDPPPSPPASLMEPPLFDLDDIAPGPDSTATPRLPRSSTSDFTVLSGAPRTPTKVSRSATSGSSPNLSGGKYMSRTFTASQLVRAGTSISTPHLMFAPFPNLTSPLTSPRNRPVDLPALAPPHATVRNIALGILMIVNNVKEVPEMKQIVDHAIDIYVHFADSPSVRVVAIAILLAAALHLDTTPALNSRGISQRMLASEWQKNTHLLPSTAHPAPSSLSSVYVRPPTAPTQQIHSAPHVPEPPSILAPAPPLPAPSPDRISHPDQNLDPSSDPNAAFPVVPVMNLDAAMEREWIEQASSSSCADLTPVSSSLTPAAPMDTCQVAPEPLPSPAPLDTMAVEPPAAVTTPPPERALTRIDTPLLASMNSISPKRLSWGSTSLSTPDLTPTLSSEELRPPAPGAATPPALVRASSVWSPSSSASGTFGQSPSSGTPAKKRNFLQRFLHKISPKISASTSTPPPPSPLSFSAVRDSAPSPQERKIPRPPSSKSSKSSTMFVQSSSPQVVNEIPRAASEESVSPSHHHRSLSRNQSHSALPTQPKPPARAHSRSFYSQSPGGPPLPSPHTPPRDLSPPLDHAPSLSPVPPGLEARPESPLEGPSLDKAERRRIVKSMINNTPDDSLQIYRSLRRRPSSLLL
eukprot:TRINITY_DN5266_c0_g1_i2.p1 TRINITY_DN5266_c0_g1~~TRINITY_DN5266_c0_g1_i2.p1  ORF type:complete len:1246 (+),score=316.36 TRINITY_DN5266_c0_g1_i2:64-3801(+)